MNAVSATNSGHLLQVRQPMAMTRTSAAASGLIGYDCIEARAESRFQVARSQSLRFMSRAYPGGLHSHCSALMHLSHRARRDCINARHNAASAIRSCGVDVILATFDGKAAASLADSFPTTHSGIVAPPDASPRLEGIRLAILDFGNTPFARVAPQTQRRPSSPPVGGAVEPGHSSPVVAGLTPFSNDNHAPEHGAFVA